MISEIALNRRRALIVCSSRLTGRTPQMGRVTRSGRMHGSTPGRHTRLASNVTADAPLDALDPTRHRCGRVGPDRVGARRPEPQRPRGSGSIKGGAGRRRTLCS